ncbi:sulfite oxidase heme-binding subunit YedZ [Undibacterium rugosum]|uniref:Protein-methionine-sulfoxide reductase heme-binding subunit MsrQ n=2 Tax=Undibacterium TaxID=401469 RepID=A0A923KZ20_9BURK|nr:protein-methionine-sulfoxide reductase heme-binding subunit MsrQ [Undibacterium rugosum]MBC3935283.1 sulfoxide reductase heme-binding subunit YedZ [Undibacterium rugosum]MBR7777877.1 sulfoxide reductase heme-binding subunit YedZ [Undibacterium rugosum]
MNLTTPQLKRLKIVLFLLALIPFGHMLSGLLMEKLGANPLEYLTRYSGDWALYFLVLTLAVTPLRKLLQQPWLLRFRRMLGLYTFFYAALHFLMFFWFDHFFDLLEMWADVLKRPFIAVGLIAFCALVPLAISSHNGVIRRMGGKAWQRLHQLIYVIAPLAVLHYYWMKAGKHDLVRPYLFAGLVAALLLYRVVVKWRDRA